MSCLGSSNGQVLGQHLDMITTIVVDRLALLAEQDLSSLNAVELIRHGLCDPVRLFVKQEPHPMRKIVAKRFRLISSVSLIDQLIERLLFGFQNQAEIASWKTCPSKPGMGLSLAEQANSIWSEVADNHKNIPACEADISGFDWSVQDWELKADIEMRIALGEFPPHVAMAARNRFHCLANSVFQLSNGELIAQGQPGLMKSGSYCTSSSNSRIRCLMAKLIGSGWCIAMGDDSVEGFVENAQEKYKLLGHECKDYIPCKSRGKELVEFNFCSHLMRQDNYYLTTWAKTLTKFLSSPRPQINDLASELETSPKWREISEWIHWLGLGTSKSIEQDEQFQPTQEETESQEESLNAATRCGYSNN